MDIGDLRAAFRAMHHEGAPFVMPNPWDAGSARLLAASGARALATTSGGHAFTLGRPDMGRVSRDEALAHASALIAATDLPVSADLEDGYGAAPEDVAATVRAAAAIGLAGCSIEDSIFGRREGEANGSYAFDPALARARAAIAAARESGIVLTLRADGILTRAYDEAEALRRVAAFAEAGADVIYAPGASPDTLRRMAALGAPVNALAAGAGAALSLSDYGALGVARVSIGTALARVTHRAILDIGAAMLARGDFTALAGAAPSAETDPLLGG